MASVPRTMPRVGTEPEHLCPDDVRPRGRHSEILSLIAAYASGKRNVKAESDLYRVGERCNAIFVVVSGWVAAYDLLQDGRRQILQIALPGALLRFSPGTGAVAMFGAEALTDVAVCTMSRSLLGTLLKNHPETGMQFAKMIACERNLSFDHLTSIGRWSARERVARLLVELFVRHRSQ